jgi:alginate O-acetyltransferase complex protein AlgJ
LKPQEKHSEPTEGLSKPARFKVRLLSVCFLLVIAFPAFDFLVGISDPPEPAENRELIGFPEFDINQLDPFPAAFEAWFEDNLPARAQLLKAYRVFKADALNTQAFPDKVLAGKDGWMFWVQKSMDDYRGTNRFTPNEMLRFEAEIEARTMWCRQRGIEYYFVIVPNKHSIYGEYLPDNIFQIDTISRMEQVLSLKSSAASHSSQQYGLNVIDLRSALRAQKAEHRVFHKTDTHWNELGAFFGYQEIIRALKPYFPSMEPSTLNDFILDTTMKQGMGLAKSLDVDKISQEQVIGMKSKQAIIRRLKNRAYPIPAGFTYPDQYAMALETDSTHLPKALIIRDSFTNDLYRLLSRNFSETVFIWDDWEYKLNERIIEQERPDVVITIVIERHLDNVLAGENIGGE